MATRGRPPSPLDPDASHCARLGAELREHRLEEGLTLQALGDLTGYTPQHISEVERAKTGPTRPFIAACDRELNACGALLDLLPAATHERDTQRRERSAARRAARDLAPLRCEAHSDAGDEDLDPTNRRGLLGAGAGAAAALGLGAAATPTQARQIDPELVSYWTGLLDLFGRHDAALGPRDLLATVRHELGRITEHRQIARGELRTELMRVEARWAEFASWLSNDAGQGRSRDVWADRALWLAHEGDDRDIIAIVRMRQGQWAVQELDAQRAVAFAEEALRVSGTSEQTRARCALRAAHGHALAGNVSACQRRLAYAYEGAGSVSSPGAVTPTDVRANEARCWMWLQPSKAIPLYESALREWPRDRTRDGGLHQARLALACAAVGERDRAKAEGLKALAIARSTKSNVAARELRRLRETLAA